MSGVANTIAKEHKYRSALVEEYRLWIGTLRCARTSLDTKASGFRQAVFVKILMTWPTGSLEIPILCGPHRREMEELPENTFGDGYNL